MREDMELTYWQGILNHSELLVKFSQAFAEILDALSFATINARLYQTASMESVVANLHVQVMRFCVRAVKWYRHHPIIRAVSSVFKPYDLAYKDIVEQMRYCSRAVKELGNAAQGAELRDIHIGISKQDDELRDIHIAIGKQENELREVRLAVVELQNRLGEGFLRSEDQLREILNVALSK